ncbi:MAG: hypothetical protein HYT35_00600 [Candidatus Staskawiczbacteria bacterium]|nr:hypothetical protein [Candidatus Staskawiczbacteria bacterium]
MSIENPSFENEPVSKSQEQENKKNILEYRDSYKEHATELQKEVAEVQAAKLETTLYKLMSRTGNNHELVNNLNWLLDSLDHQATFGDPSKPLHEARQKNLISFLEETAKALRFTVGGGERPADVKVDLSKWELNK